jgi:group I intron endonuclease
MRYSEMSKRYPKRKDALYLYIIENLITGESYIGKTVEPALRWSVHKSPKSTCRYIKAAIKKYGSNNFSFRVLALGDPQYINDLEIRAIAAFQTKAPRGYNLTDGGEGFLPGSEAAKTFKGRKHTEESKKLISKANKGHPGLRGTDNSTAILTDDLVRYIRQSPKRQIDLANELGISKNLVHQVVKFKTWQHIK